MSARTRDIPGELGVFALLSKYFNGYDDQRMELALDCRAEELESLCREGSGKPDSVKASEEKLYQLLTEGIPAMQKVAAVYISQSIKQMRVTKRQTSVLAFLCQPDF